MKKNQHFENALHFYKLGFNITCLTGEGETFYHPFPKSISDFRDEEIRTKIRFKSPSHDYTKYAKERQQLNELEQLDWDHAHGLGVVTGFSDIAIIDIDGASNDALVLQLLEILNLPKNYEWVVRSGKGYHIYFEKIDYSWEWSKQKHTYLPNEDYATIFDSLELLLDGGHAILPNSKHMNGKNYKFLNTELPKSRPLNITMENLMKGISNICDFSKVPLFADSSHYYYYRTTPFEPYTMTHGPFYLIVDTETNGLPNEYSFDINNVENWPEMLQIAWQLYDQNFNLVKEKAFFINHEEINLQNDALKINGISADILKNEGQNIKKVLPDFFYDLSASCIVVGHNIEFDLNIIHAEAIRHNIDLKAWIYDWTTKTIVFENLQTFCTMKNTTELVGIPHLSGFKFPTLMELYQKLFVHKFSDSHDALSDVKATAKCFKELITKHGFKINS
jgi:DNA polymerase III epsilon subunit-like protein